MAADPRLTRQLDPHYTRITALAQNVVLTTLMAQTAHLIIYANCRGTNKAGLGTESRNIPYTQMHISQIIFSHNLHAL